MAPAEPRELFSADAIGRRVAELGRDIGRDYPDGEMVLVAVLKGAFVFLADLSRSIQRPHYVDFVAVSSYGKSTSSGEVRLIMDVRQSLEGRHVLLVDDILDTGKTLHYLIELLRARNPASLATAVLLSKPDRREVDMEADYTGFTVPDVWVVGYGLDVADRYRNLPYLGALDDDGVARAQGTE